MDDFRASRRYLGAGGVLLNTLVLAAAPSSEAPPPPTLDGVTKALTELQGALEIGVLRPQCAEMLQQRLPVARTFVQEPAGGLHPDVATAVAQAVDSYQNAAHERSAWT